MKERHDIRLREGEGEGEPNPELLHKVMKEVNGIFQDSSAFTSAACKLGKSPPLSMKTLLSLSTS